MDLSKVGYFIPDVKPLYPHSMDKFWDMWNNNKEPLTKVKKDSLDESRGNDLFLATELPQFDGMITYLKTDGYVKGSTWKQNVVLEPSLWDPYVEELEDRMPWFECDTVVLWACLRVVPYHIDPAPLFPGPVAIRSLIYDNNPSPTFKVRHTLTKKEQHVPYNENQNLFAFNNRNFYHGADFNKNHYKILMRAFGKVKYPELLLKQVEHTKDKGFPLWEM